MGLLKQSSTAQPLMFLLLSSTDGKTPVTGLGSGPTVTLSKNGAAFGSPAGAISEVGVGWYKVAGNATDTATLGPLVLHATGTGADPADAYYEVVAYDPQDGVHFGLSALPNAAAGANTGLPLGNASGYVTVVTNNDKTGYTASTVSDKTGYSLAADQAVNVTKINGTTQTARDIGLSVLVSSGTGTGQIDVTSGVVKANLAQILGTALTETAGQIAAGFKKFFNIATPASTMDALTSIGAVAGAVGSVTGNVGGNVTGSVGSVVGAVGSVTSVSDKTGYALTAGEHTSIATDAQTGLTAQGYSSTRAGYLDTLNRLVQHAGTAQAGGLNGITLAVGASATNDLYKGTLLVIHSGTGAGQSRAITGYNGSSKVVTVDRAWATTPDATSQYIIMAAELPIVDANGAILAGAVLGNVNGSLLGHVVGYVGSVQGDVGGNVLGSVASVTAPVSADVNTWRGDAPNDLIAGRVDAAPTAEAIRSEIDANSTRLIGIDNSVLDVGNAVADLTIPSSADIAAAVWAAVSRTLSAFGFDVTATVDVDAIAAAIVSALGGLTAPLTHLDTMLEAAGPDYRFTTTALGNVPVGIIGLAAGGSRLFGSALGASGYPGQTLSTRSKIYNQGDTVRFAVTFSDGDGALANPTTVRLRLKIGAVESDYDAASTPPLLADGSGAYHIDLVLATHGVLLWRWEGAGAVTAGNEGRIGVRASFA